MREIGDRFRGAHRLLARFAGASMLALATLSASAVGLAAMPGQPAVTLDQLMKSLAQRKHGKVTYVEEDDLALLDRPVKSSGVLVYEAPDHLEKRTLKPKKESLVVDGDQMTVHRGHRTYRVQLSSYPQVGPFVDALRDTLAGNAAGLQKIFRVDLSGSMADWKLQLVPSDEEVARKVRQVQIAGSGDVIRSVAILQVNGDRSVMTLGASTDAAGAAGPSGGDGPGNRR
jgi:outer membrane lipoprotein-sorting protein